MAGRKLASVQSVHDVAPIEKPGACKTLVVGDLHCKMSLVLPRVTDTALSHCCDSVVLLGDLCDDWGVDGRAMVRQLEYAVEWKAKAEALKLCLWGTTTQPIWGLRAMVSPTKMCATRLRRCFLMGWA